MAGVHLKITIHHCR